MTVHFIFIWRGYPKQLRPVNWTYWLAVKVHVVDSPMTVICGLSLLENSESCFQRECRTPVLTLERKFDRCPHFRSVTLQPCEQKTNTYSVFIVKELYPCKSDLIKFQMSAFVAFDRTWVAIRPLICLFHFNFARMLNLIYQALDFNSVLTNEQK